MIHNLRLAAIYTTYHPDSNFRKRIENVIKNSSATIVVDNTPGGHSFSAEEMSGVTLLQDGVNRGLGAALNAGIKEARAKNCNAVVLFDQDSSPSAEFTTALLQGLVFAGSLVIIGPKLIDDKLKNTSANVYQLNNVSQFKEVTCIATSGMCFRIDNVARDELFTEDFFLDFVDFDWCWRMRSKGWKVFQLNSLEMDHRLGLAQRKFLGLTYHIPAPYRHYFQFRDALKLIGIYYVPIYSRFRLSAILLPKLIIYPFLLDRGCERFIWMLRGIIDAFLGVCGIGAAYRKLDTGSNQK